ncbi:MAG: DUF4412 domain-containing protein [Ferruginibacter sp.]
MKKTKAIFLLMSILSTGLMSFSQKTIAEGIIVYNITLQTENVPSKTSNTLNSATSTIYLKGSQIRTDMKSALGNESTIVDIKTGDAVILKEYSGQKLMITLNKDNWIEKNKRFDDAQFTPTDKTKTINGYNCKQAIAKLKDGSSVAVYYSTELMPVNKEYNITFKNLPGLAMEYEFVVGKTIYIYTVSKISQEAVPASKFDIPKSGYRIMTYEENKQIKKGE